MIKTGDRASQVAVVVFLAALLSSCGGSTMTETSGGGPGPSISVAVTPGSVALPTGPGGSTQFSATVTGATNTAVTWAVNGVAGGNSTLGTIGADGLYSAPSMLTAQQVTISAASAADSTKSASATVILEPPGQVAATQNPQVAQYSFTSPTDATVTIQFGTDMTYGLQTWSQPVVAGGGTVNMLVAGMKANTTYHMRASVQYSNGVQYFDSDHTFTTGGLPASRLPIVTITVPRGPETSPGIELVDLSQPPSNAIQAAALDLDGNVIWYYDISNIPGVSGDLPFPIKLLSNGHMRIVIGAPSANAVVSTEREIDLAGNTISEITTADLNARLKQAGYSLVSLGFHHDFASLPNGHTVYLVLEQREVVLAGDTTPTLATGDSLVDVDPSGNPVWVWSTFDHLDVNDHPFGIVDWTHCNAIVYSPTDGDLMLSSRSLSWVMKIDYANGKGTGNIVWKLGPDGDFTLQNGGPSDWFYNQHYPVFLSPLTSVTYQLGVWDNGNLRPDPVTGAVCSGEFGSRPCYSRGVIMTVNEPARTATIDWQDNLSPIFAMCCGNIDEESNGNIVMGAGGVSFSPAATETLEVTQQPAPQVVWQMNITGQFSYRMIRIPSLYPGVTW